MAYGDDPRQNPYAAPEEDFAPVSDVGPTKAYGYGGFWLRFVAFIVDGIVLSVVSFPLSIALAVVFGPLTPPAPGQPFPAEFWPRFGINLGFGECLRIAYYALMQSSSYQATLGKMALGLKVTDMHGRRLTLLHAVGREAARIITNFTCTIGYIIAGLTARKQALHDMIAGTLVIKTRP